MNEAEQMEKLIAELARQYPATPFLALGQTVLWDEPMKAVWRRLLDRYAPHARLIAGVHDTDYFAKTTALVHDDHPYVSLPHDDAATRGLWSAAGEISALFGSEDLPSRALYEKYGVPFDTLAERYPGDKARFIGEHTEAWGWRGIVETGAHQRIARDIPLDQFLPALREQLRWAFDLSAQQLAPELRERATGLHARMTGWIDDFERERSGCCLADLYTDLLPRLYALLLGHTPDRFETTTSLHLFRFNRDTCLLPRFRFVDLFLNPQTKAVAREAYDHAVVGGGMYALDAFGEGALPFDIVVAGIGRGTLHVTGARIVVDLPAGHKLTVDRAVTSVTELAQTLEAHLGQEIALVGKAVALISMIASEFVIVFHETASGYTDRTKAMNDSLRASGIVLDLHPIVRLQYPTWDALTAVGARAAFKLPPHLAASFGRARISAAEFGETWRAVVDRQRATLLELQRLRTARSLMSYLDSAGDPTQCWTCHLDKYDEAHETLAGIAQSLARLKGYIAHLKEERRALRGARARLQDRKGAHFRRMVQPLRERMAETSSADERARLEDLIARRERSRQRHFAGRLLRWDRLVRQMGRVIQQWRSELRRVERSPDALEARQIAAGVAADAQYARMERVRAGILTTTSLPHTQARPTAWWIPLIDPTGAWFDAIVAGTKARLERV